MPADWHDALGILAYAFHWSPRELDDLTLADCRRWLTQVERTYGQIAKATPDPQR